MLKIVENAAARLFYRQDYGPLISGGADDPAEADAKYHDHDDQSAELEPQVPAPWSGEGFGE